MARIQLPPTLVEAIAGAMGEVSQIIALYPLDTIKVSWQAAGRAVKPVLVLRNELSLGFRANKFWESRWHVDQASHSLISILRLTPLPSSMLFTGTGSVPVDGSVIRGGHPGVTGTGCQPPAAAQAVRGRMGRCAVLCAGWGCALCQLRDLAPPAAAAPAGGATAGCNSRNSRCSRNSRGAVLRRWRHLAGSRDKRSSLG